jgi:prolyl-tRNA editing enzyme YbaK/EbsC (Cys-tRNA(Pro) deacylase)
VHSLEQAAAERGQQPEQVVRSILFRLAAAALSGKPAKKAAAGLSSRPAKTDEGQYVMVLVAGPNQISWPALRKHLGRSRLTTASEDEVLAATGYPLGAVSPFGLPAPIRVLVDRSVPAQKEVSLGSGVRGVTVILSTEDLMRALGNVETGVFSA